MENEKAARNKKIKHAIMIIFLAILFVAFVFPFIMVIINVFKVKADITAAPLALIGKHGFTLENFPNAIEKMNFFRSFGNSLIITIFATIGTIILSSMTAYLIVRNDWKANKILFVLYLNSSPLYSI